MQRQCSQGQCSHLPLEGAHEEGEGPLTWSLPTFPSLVPIQPVFGKTTPPRVPTWPGRGLGIPGAVAGLKDCHFQCEQTGMQVTPHLSTSCPGGMSFSFGVLVARSWLEALLSHTCLCESVASLEGVCLIPHQKALGTSEQRLQRQLATEATSAAASGAGGVCRDVFRLLPTSAMKLGAGCRGQGGNGRGRPWVSLVPSEPWRLYPCFLPPAWDI